MIVGFIQILLLSFLSFVPVWVGGQAMKCYDAGHLIRSVLSIMIAVFINMGVLYSIYEIGRYNLTFVTILRFIVEPA